MDNIAVATGRTPFYREKFRLRKNIGQALHQADLLEITNQRPDPLTFSAKAEVAEKVTSHFIKAKIKTFQFVEFIVARN